MSGGRDAVLASIRQSLGRTGPSRDAIVPLPGAGPRPSFDDDVVERFEAKMLEKSATLVRLASFADVAAEVARFVASVNAGKRLCVAPALAAIDWPAGFEVEHRAARREDETSVTPCFAAVAESGAVVTLSGPDTPSTLNFVPDNHIVVVQAAQVVRDFEDVWTQWRASGRLIPRSINMISGPSRTADIEMTIQLGAHGPRRLHILLIAS